MFTYLCLNDVWMCVKHLFYLPWVDVLPTSNQHVFDPTHDLAVAIVKHDSSIPKMHLCMDFATMKKMLVTYPV